MHTTIEFSEVAHSAIECVGIYVMIMICECWVVLAYARCTQLSSWVLGYPSSSLIFQLVIFRLAIKFVWLPMFFLYIVGMFPLALVDIGGRIEWLMAGVLAVCFCIVVWLWYIVIMYFRKCNLNLIWNPKWGWNYDESYV